MDYPSRYAEFFCGGGMVRAALNSNWECAIANDIDPMKCGVYRENWSGSALIEADVASLDEGLLKQPIDLFWASSPCQDFSLAGKGLGLEGARSGIFNIWFEKIKAAVHAGYAPRIIAFENVTGLVSRRSGKDLDHVLTCFISLGYNVCALEIDASHFVPQSRPRLFVIAVQKGLALENLCSAHAEGPFHSPRIAKFHATASPYIKAHWVWFRLPLPRERNGSLESILDSDPDTPWLSHDQVERLLSLMSDPSLSRIETAKRTGKTAVGTLYKRGRPDASGCVRQRAEVRFDGFAGCLRTPAGGSSRQTILIVENDTIKARLLSRREIVRLMGLPTSYRMPERYNDVYRVAGDGVVVPIVKHLDEFIFQPVLRNRKVNKAVA